MGWLVPRDEMTPDQLRAIEMKPTEHRVVFGAPGSGKTQIVLHRARHLLDDYGIPEDRFHIFVYTNILKEYIRSALDDLDLPETAISTLDAWCTTYHRERIKGKLPWDATAKRPDFAAIKAAVLAHATQHSPSEKLYDFVLVDEGQDLDQESFSLLKAIARHVTVCMDNKQKLYEQGQDEQSVLAQLNLKQRNISLLSAYRCSPYIVELASRFLENANERASYVQQAKTTRINIETPVLYWSKNTADEHRRLLEVIQVRLKKGERVGILVPQRRQVFVLGRLLEEAGLPVEYQGRRNHNTEMSFDNELPKVLTFHSAKGLTFDSIILPSLTTRAFGRYDADQLKRLLFVGITRATKWVFLSAEREAALPMVTALEGADMQGILTIQAGSTIKAPSVVKAPEENLLDLL